MASMCPVPQPQSVSRSHPEVVPPRRPHGIVTSNPWTSRYIEAAGLVSVSQGPPLNRQHPKLIPAHHLGQPAKLTPAHHLGQPAKLTPALAFNHSTTSPHRALSNGGDDPLSVIGRDITFRSRVSKLREAFELDWNMNRKERLSRRMEGIVNETLRLGSGHPHTLLQSEQRGDLGRGDQIANGLGQLHPQKIGQTKATVVPGSSNLSTQQPSGERMIQHPLEPESQHAPPAYDLESRAERIARYKAERRRQLAEQFGINIPDDADVRSTPKRNECLNIVSPPEASSRVSTSYSLLQRPGQGSITLKMQEDYKTCASPSMKQDTVIQQASSSAVTLKDPAAHEDSADSPTLRCHQIWGHKAQVQRNMAVPLENKTSGGMEEVKLHLPLESRTCRREESRGRFLSSSLVEKHQEDFSSPNVTSMSRLSPSNYDRTSIDHSLSLDPQQAIITSSRTEEVVTHPSADTAVLSALRGHKRAIARNGNSGLSLGKQPAITAHVDHEHEPRQCEDYKRHPLLGGGDSVITRIRDKAMTTTCSSNLLNTNRGLKRRERAHSSGAGWPSTPNNLKPFVKMSEGSHIVKNSGRLLHGLGNSQPSRQCTRLQSVVRSGISRECIRTCVEPSRQVEEPHRLNEFQDILQDGSGDGEAEVSVETRISVTELRSLFAETLKANRKSNVSSHEGRSRNGENRRLNERFHTQPITSTERQQTLYSASQQGVVSTSSQPLKRANTTDIMEGGDKTDEKARMSMAAKLSLFQAMGPVPKKAAAPSNTQKQPASLAWHQRSGPSRIRDVSQECPPHKSSKVLHSPTTCRAPVALKTETTSNREPSVHMEQGTYEEPDNSRLSLVEKMALFTRFGQAISSGVAPEQRVRRSSQRFQTQPLMADELSPNLDHSNTRASEAGSSAIKPAAWTSQHPLIGAQVAASAQQSFSSYKSIQTTCLSGDVQSSVNRQLPFTVSRNGGATLVAVPTLVEPSRQAGSTFEKTPATYNSGPGRGAEEEDEEPDNSRLTLAEKMALFTQLSKGGPKTLVQRNRRSIPRFQTQPVTASEVHSASLATTSIAQVASSVTYSQKQSSQQKIIVSGRPIQTGPVEAFKGSEGHHVPGTRAESGARETSTESPFHAWRERATIDPSLISRRSFDHMGDTDPKQKTDSSIEQAVHVSVAAETTAPWRKGLKTREKMVDTRKQQLQSLPKFPLSNVEQLRTSPVDTVTSYKRSKHEDHGWKERVVGHIDSKETSVRLEWQQRSQEIRQQQEIHIVGQREFAPLEKSVVEGGETREKMGNEVLKVSFIPTESLSPARASHEVQKKDSKPPNLEWHSDLHHSSHWVSITSDSQETHDKYLDMVTESSSSRLLTSIAAEHRRAIRPVRKSARSRNPLRVLAEREDVSTDLIERGSPRRGDQTEEGLRAAEIQCSSETVSPSAKNRQTFQPLMLIQVKGRKHVQVRVIEPCAHSVGPGICVVLVTAQSCFLWLGHEANTSEKIKATKLAAQIQHGQELGCKASVVTVLKDRNIYSGDEATTFWTLLGTQHHTAPPCSPEKSTPCNEESYEHDIIATNCLFRLQGQCLVPDDKFWGKAPPHAILQTRAVLVFDFGTEIYTWIGEDVGPKSRRLAGLLAQQLWIGPYDYSTCRINPLGPRAARRGNGRPDWAVYSQIDQGRELLLFREKFLDWPGVQQEVLSKELIEEEEEEASIAQQLLSGTSKLADRDLAHQALDHLTGKQPITTSIEIWLITGTSCSLLEQPTLAHFYDGDSYLVMWRFKLRNSGGKETEEGSRSEYCTSFLWQGKKVLQGSDVSMVETVLHKCGCKSKMLVPQGKEPAAFLRLFHGSLVILLGSRDKKMELAADGPRLFCVCGDLPGEGCLLETPCKAQSLRSRASMLLLDVRRRNLHLWHGCRSSAGNRNLSRKALAQLHGAPPMDCEIEREATFTLHEFGEGAEPTAFWESLGSRDRSTYDCLLHTQGWSDSRPRLFHLSAPGERQVTEYPAHGFHCLPFVQRDLCVAAQPALFLMDAQQQVFLWKGWCLPDRERPGSWDAEIKRALLICHEYCKGRAELAAREGVEPPEAFVICAGHEPLSFTNLFPCWESWKCVNPTENKHGRRKQQVLLLEDVLERLGDPSRQCPPISDWLEHQSHVFG